jgi:hypothetical protein
MNKKRILRDSVIKSGVLRFFILEPDIIEPAEFKPLLVKKTFKWVSDTMKHKRYCP